MLAELHAALPWDKVTDIGYVVELGGRAFLVTELNTPVVITSGIPANKERAEYDEAVLDAEFTADLQTKTISASTRRRYVTFGLSQPRPGDTHDTELAWQIRLTEDGWAWTTTHLSETVYQRDLPDIVRAWRAALRI